MASPGKPAGFTTDTSQSYPSNLTNVNGTLYFWADDSINGYEPWKIDGTGNAVLVKDINPGLKQSYPSYFTNVDGKTYFNASDATNGSELWTINSAGNAVLVKDINPGAGDSFPAEFTTVNGTLYFTASDATDQRDLWKVDSNGNAMLVKDVNPSIAPSYSVYASNLTNVDGTLYFTANDFANENPYEQKLWKTDNSGDTVLVKNLSSDTDPDFSSSSSFTNVNGNLYFVTSKFTPTGLDDNPITPNNRQELWRIDTTGNIVLVKSNPGPESFSLSNLTNVNGTLYFTDIDGTNGEELWRIDSTGNAVLVKNIRSGPYSSYIYYSSNLTNINGTLYFTAIDATNGEELWKVDSTGNAMLVKDINADNNSSSYLSNLTNVNGNLYFIVSIIGDATGRQELWRIDSMENAVLVKDIGSRLDPYYNQSSAITNVNSTLYFTANDVTNGQELWRIDSTGTAVLVKDINPGTDSSQPSDLTNVNGTLYFTAYDAVTGRELWKIDPEGNAVLVKDINPVSTSRDPIYSRFRADNGGPSGEGGDSPSPLTPDKTAVVDLFNRNMLETTNEIKGVSIQAISQKQTNKVNEIGFFNVDDRAGKIDGIAPGEAGYIKAAIERSKSILTTLGGDFFNTEKQEIGLDPNKIYQFFEIENGSLTEVKQQLNRGEIPTNIRLSNLDANGYSSIKITGNSIQSGYDISINNDELILKVTKLDGLLPNRPIGSESQGKSEGRIIDLTNYGDRSLTVDIITKSDAVYQSQIGFYVVKDAIGTIELADGTTVKPGDVNYAMVAVKNAISNAGLQANRIDSKTNQPIAGSQIYAPVVVAQGTMDDFVKNPSNNIHAYFNYVGANTDKVDHFRQIGANTFGVEDMYGGGDRDFNDIVIQMNVRTV